MDNKLLFVGSIIGGCIAVVVVIYNLVFAPLSLAICQEAQARCSNEAVMKKEINDKLDTLLTYAIDTKTTLASYVRQVDINTKRIDNLERKNR